jgi:hypothetical protein
LKPAQRATIFGVLKGRPLSKREPLCLELHVRSTLRELLASETAVGFRMAATNLGNPLSPARKEIKSCAQENKSICFSGHFVERVLQ